MADRKISELTAYATALDADIIPIVQVASLVTKKITVANLFSGRVPTVASGAEVTTGTDNAKFISALALANASIVAVAAASTTVAGKIEVATGAETTTGTDATRAVSPDGLAESDYGKRVVCVQVVDAATNTATGDGKAFFRIPTVMNGWNLVAAAAHVYAAGTTNTTDIQLRRVRGGSSADMLSTKLTIDSAEVDTLTAAAAAVINTSNDDVATGDIIAVDVDAVSSTPAQGLAVEMIFQLP